MANKKKSWVEKLKDNKNLPKIQKLLGKAALKWGGKTMVVPAPIEVDEIMKKIPKGKLITINEIRQILAEKHGAEITCPLTTGIFAWIASYAAEEEREGRGKSFTPYWRTLKSGGILNDKYPGGAIEQKKKLEKEGHKVVKKGKNYVVADYEKSLSEFCQK